MENSPEEYQSPEFYIQYGPEKFTCTPETCSGWIHGDDPDHDHLFITYIENGEEKGLYGFRNSLENFDDLIEFMQLNDYVVNFQEETSEFDLKVYNEYMEKRSKRIAEETAKLLAQQKLAELETEKLNPRKERIVSFFKWLMDNDALDVEFPD